VQNKLFPSTKPFDCEILYPGVEIVSDHIGPRKFFEFPENISPRRKRNCKNLDKKKTSDENSHHGLRHAIISTSILIVR
jgi:hypothetical protein